MFLGSHKSLLCLLLDISRHIVCLHIHEHCMGFRLDWHRPPGHHKSPWILHGYHRHILRRISLRCNSYGIFLWALGLKIKSNFWSTGSIYNVSQKQFIWFLSPNGGRGGVDSWHVAVASGKIALSAASLHSNPGPQDPQSKLLLGLKHGPHSSPSCFVPRNATASFFHKQLAF